MNILMTGATGLIGSALASALVKKYQNNNVKLTVVSRTLEKRKNLPLCEVKLLDDIDEHTIAQQNVIINLAGEPIADKRWSTQQKENIINSRIEVTKKLANLIQHTKTPPHTFISGSAIGYYGRQAPEKIIKEDFKEVNNEFSHQLCAMWEAEALKAQSTQTRVCLLRTGIVLDKNKGALAKMLPAFKMGGGAVMADGKQMMSWIHIDDMVNAILHIIECQSLSGPINLTAPYPVSNIAFSKILANTLNRPCLLKFPACILKFMFGEMADLFIHGQQVIPDKLQASGYQYRFEKIEVALENILQNSQL